MRYGVLPYLRISRFVWGEHPIAFFGARLHNNVVVMFTHKTMKTILSEVNRSGFHYFTNPTLPVKRASETGFDVLGAVTVVSLSAGMAVLMRLILAN